jgi:hypothetical protein
MVTSAVSSIILLSPPLLCNHALPSDLIQRLIMDDPRACKAGLLLDIVLNLGSTKSRLMFAGVLPLVEPLFAASAAYSLPHDDVQSSEVPLSTSPNRSVLHYQLLDGLTEVARTVGPATACRSTG